MNNIEIEKLKEKAIELNRTLIEGQYGYHRLLEVDGFVVKNADPFSKEPKMEIFQKIV